MPDTDTIFPRRRIVLKLKLGADDRIEMLAQLEHIATELRRGAFASCDVASGGYSSGYTLHISEDETVTHDSYYAALKALDEKPATH